MSKTNLVDKNNITEHEQAEIALQNSEERYRSLIEATTTIIWTTDGSGGFVVPQPSWEKYTGQPWSEHKDFGWMKKVHPDDIEHILKEWKKAIREISHYETWGRVWNANLKEWRDFEVRAVPIINQNGSLREWVGIITDTTERKKTEKKIGELNKSLEQRVAERTEELQKSEERYRLLVEGARIIGWEYNPYEDRFTFVSGKAQEITGYTNEQWGEKGFWTSHIYHEDKDSTVRYCKDATKKGEDHEFEYRMITADGGFIWLRDIVQVVLNNGKVTKLRGVLVDITERKKAEEQNKTILRTALDGFWVTDIEGRLLEVNDAYCNLIGYSREELLKMSIPDVEALESPEDTKKHIQQIIKTGSDRFESKHRCKNGRIIDIEISTNYMDTKGGRFFVFIRDITERKKAEKILQEQKEALEKKNIALHEVLGQIEIEKKQIKDNVIANAENLLLPIIEKIGLKEESSKYAQLLQKNLHELTSSFGAGLSGKKSKLTSREIDICNMIKNGLTSKEIAGLLNISLQTIEKHRSHIRKKLGIVNRKRNLTSVLKTL